MVSCWCDDFGKAVAVKVIKNQPAYYHQVRVYECVHAIRLLLSQLSTHSMCTLLTSELSQLILPHPD